MNANFLRVQRGSTLVELLVVITIIGVLAGLLLPAVQQAREAARRMDCSSKMANLAKAVDQFHVAYKVLPTGSRVAPGTGTPPRISCITKILPYIDQANLYALYQVTRDWNDDRTPPGSAVATSAGPLVETAPSNRAISQIRIPLLNCPSSTNPDRKDGDPDIRTSATPYINAAWTENYPVTDYSAVLGVSYRLAFLGTAAAPIIQGEGILSQANPGRMADVKDGLSTTILFAESAGRPTVYRKSRIPPGTLTPANRVNGGAWARPASDFYIDGARITDLNSGTASFPGLTITNVGIMNITNGEDVGGSVCSAATGYPRTASLPLNPVPTGSTSTTAYGATTGSTFLGTGEVYSFHVGGSNIAFGDGAVRFMAQETGVDEFARLSTRESGEVVRKAPD